MTADKSGRHLGISTEALSILMIDDNPDDCDLFLTRLKDVATVPLKAKTASRLSDGLDLIKQHVFHVLLLDINLPDSKGAVSVQKIQEAWPTLPIVALSSFAEPEMGHEALSLGAEEYICKSDATGEALFRAICHAIDRKKREVGIARLLMSSTAELFEKMNGRYVQSGECGARVKGIEEKVSALQRSVDTLSDTVRDRFIAGFASLRARVNWLYMLLGGVILGIFGILAKMVTDK